jgi:hypothetical protein
VNGCGDGDLDFFLLKNELIAFNQLNGLYTSADCVSEDVC